MDQKKKYLDASISADFKLFKMQFFCPSFANLVLEYLEKKIWFIRKHMLTNKNGTEWQNNGMHRKIKWLRIYLGTTWL